MQQRTLLRRLFLQCCAVNHLTFVFLEQLELVHESLALLADFPVSLHVIVFHLLHTFCLKGFHRCILEVFFGAI